MSSPQTIADRSKEQTKPNPVIWVWRSLLLLLTLLAFANSFQGVWVFDDHPYILDNGSIRDLTKPWRVFMGEGRNRPLGHLTFAVNYHFGRYDPQGYHVLNLAIHAAAALTLFTLLNALLRAPALSGRYAGSEVYLAFAVAAWFALHPVQVQSVTYIYQRLESLASLWYLLAVLAFVHGRLHARAWAYGLSWLCAVLGVLTKEVAVTIPMTAFLLDGVLFSRSWWRPLQQRGWVHGLLATTIAIPVVMTLVHREFYLEQGMLESRGEIPSRWEYLYSQGLCLLHYVRITVLPFGLSLDAGWKVPPLPVGLPAMVAVAAWFVIVAWQTARLKLWALPGLIFFVLLGPTSSLIPIVDLMFEHRIYLAMSCLQLWMVLGALEIAHWRAGARQSTLRHQEAREVPRWLMSLWGCVTLVLVILTLQRNQFYQSESALHRENVRVNPLSTRAVCNLATVLHLEGKGAEVVPLLLRSLELDPKYFMGWANLGNLYAMQGETAAAIACGRKLIHLNGVRPSGLTHAAALFATLEIPPPELLELLQAVNTAAEKFPKDDRLWLEIAKWELQAGQATEGERKLQMLMERGTKIAEVYNSLGTECAKRGDLKAAGDLFARAVELYGRDASEDASLVRVNYARSLLARGEFEAAISSLRTANDLTPDDAAVFTAWGDALAERNPAEAERYYRRGLELQSSLPDTSFNLALLLAKQGRPREAIPLLQHTLKLSPNHPQALGLLASLAGAPSR